MNPNDLLVYQPETSKIELLAIKVSGRVLFGQNDWLEHPLSLFQSHFLKAVFFSVWVEFANLEGQQLLTLSDLVIFEDQHGPVGPKADLLPLHQWHTLRRICASEPGSHSEPF